MGQWMPYQLGESVEHECLGTGRVNGIVDSPQGTRYHVRFKKNSRWCAEWELGPAREPIDPSDRAYAMASCTLKKIAMCDREGRSCRHCPPMPKEGLTPWLDKIGYYRKRIEVRGESPTRDLEACFNASVEKQANGCWNWKGTVHSNGMPALETGTGKIYAHRWAFKRYVDPNLSDDVRTVRTCDSRLCVNPDHVVVLRRRNAKSS